MTTTVDLEDGRLASYRVVGNGLPTLMFPGGPGFSAAYMNEDAEMFSDFLRSYLIDPHGSGFSTAPADPAGYSPEGHARFYEEARQALGLPGVVVVGHSFGATTALTYAALYPESTVACVAVGAMGLGTEADAVEGGAAAEEMEAMLTRHAGAAWYDEARKVMDDWTERILAATEPAEMEQMMAMVLPLYVAEPDKPEVAAGLDRMRGMLKADLAAGKAWEGGLYQGIDLRPLLGRISCPTLIVAGGLDFICGPAQARPINAGIGGSQLVIFPDCGHSPSFESPEKYRKAVLGFLHDGPGLPLTP